MKTEMTEGHKIPRLQFGIYDGAGDQDYWTFWRMVNKPSECPQYAWKSLKQAQFFINRAWKDMNGKLAKYMSTWTIGEKVWDFPQPKAPDGTVLVVQCESNITHINGKRLGRKSRRTGFLLFLDYFGVLAYYETKFGYNDRDGGSWIKKFNLLYETEQGEERRKRNEHQMELVQLAEEKKQADLLKSQHVGEQGDRREFTLKIVHIAEYDSVYGRGQAYSLEDKDGNRFTWMTGGNGIYIKEDCADTNDTVTLLATIKSHGEFRGQKVTYLTRAKTLEIHHPEETENA